MRRFTEDQYRLIIKLICMAITFVILAVPALAGTKVRPLVRKIEVVGNNHIATIQILSMVTRTKVGMPVQEDLVKEDLQAIADLGYFSDLKASFEPFDDGVKVIFRLSENPLVQAIEITGSTALPSDDLRALVPVKDGEVLNVRALNKGLEDMLAAAFRLSGIPMSIRKVFVDDLGLVQVELAETQVGQILVSGNERTSQELIRAEMKSKPGDPLNIPLLDEDLRSLRNLGLFSEISREIVEGTEANVVDIRVLVKEIPSSHLSVGGFYNPDDGLLGSFDYGEDNLFGRGMQLRLGWEFGKSKSHLQLGLAGLSFYNETHIQNDQYGEYTLTETGVDARVKRELGDDLEGYLNLRVYDTTTDYAGEELDRQGETRSLKVGLVKDTRDYDLGPSSGFRGELALETAPNWLDSYYQYYRLTAEYQGYFPAGSKGQILSLRGRAGHLVQNGELTLNSSELFRVGGPETLRGYSNTRSFLGQTMLIGNAEYHLQITPKINGLLFYDLGNAWPKGESVDISDLHEGYGAGLQIQTGLGLVGLEYGVGADGGQAYFSLKQTF